MGALTAAEIREALTLNSPSLVKEVYDIVYRQIQSEAARQSILDSKAGSLLAAVGLSLTLSLTLGCQVLLGQYNALAALPQWHRLSLVIALAAGMLCALVSSGHAVWSLKITGAYRTISGSDVFNKDVLRRANEHGLSQGIDEQSVTAYRRYLMPQLWEIVQNDFAVHERKAKIVMRGQMFFLAFIASLVAISLLIAGRVAFQFL